MQTATLRRGERAAGACEAGADPAAVGVATQHDPRHLQHVERELQRGAEAGIRRVHYVCDGAVRKGLARLYAETGLAVPRVAASEEERVRCLARRVRAEQCRLALLLLPSPPLVCLEQVVERRRGREREKRTLGHRWWLRSTIVGHNSARPYLYNAHSHEADPRAASSTLPLTRTDITDLLLTSECAHSSCDRAVGLGHVVMHVVMHVTSTVPPSDETRYATKVRRARVAASPSASPAGSTKTARIL